MTRDADDDSDGHRIIRNKMRDEVTEELYKTPPVELKDRILEERKEEDERIAEIARQQMNRLKDTFRGGALVVGVLVAAIGAWVRAELVSQRADMEARDARIQLKVKEAVKEEIKSLRDLVAQMKTVP